MDEGRKSIWGIRRMRKYIHLFRAFLIYSIEGKLEYRFDFIINVLRSVGWLFVGVFSFQILFTQTATIGGWTKAEAMSLFGIFIIITHLWYVLGRNFAKQ
jgi:ABC-type uncharacterized transport system permease subunit